MDTFLQDNYLAYGVLAQDIDYLWEEILPFLKKALTWADGQYSEEDVKKALIVRDMQLWVVYNTGKLQGICITQIIQYPQLKRLRIPFLAGVHFKKWSGGWIILKKWAKAQGCTDVEIFGRQGWERLLRPIGFKKTHTLLKVNL